MIDPVEEAVALVLLAGFAAWLAGVALPSRPARRAGLFAVLVLAPLLYIIHLVGG